MYKEIHKLKAMLEEANIPHYATENLNIFHICYPSNNNTIVCSAIQGKNDMADTGEYIEIMGLLKSGEYPSRKPHAWDVVGGLTAEDVFDRIFVHYTNTENKVRE